MTDIERFDNLEEMFEKHQEKEPKKYCEKAKEVGLEMKSSEWNSWKFNLDRLTDMLNVSEPKRNEILRVIKSGKTLGEVCKEFEETLAVVSDILYFNIKKMNYLPEVSI